MDQTQTVAFLENELGPRSRARIDTHISTILMGGNRTFKLKRAVKVPYADFSTPELRLDACEEEMRLNVRTASTLYVGVRMITRTENGALEFNGKGELVDAVVEMQRFHQRDLFDRMADDARLTTDIARLTASRIARFHEALPADPATGGADAIAYAININRKMLGSVGVFAPAKVAEVLERVDQKFKEVAPLLDARGKAGFVRRCHGDLHLGNICLLDGAPTLFDCLDFSVRLATADVLYDLAFFLMDLWRYGLTQQANAAFNRYLDETGDLDHLGLLPFLMAVRAVVRAHVLAAQATQGVAPDPLKERDAHGYLALAQSLLTPTRPRLVAIGGMSGTGKSSLASHLAHRVGAAPGARIFSTDRIRKALFGVSASTRLPQEAYSSDVSIRVYQTQRDLAARVLTGGHSAVADGVFLKADEREAISLVAADANADFQGIWLRAAPQVLVRRVEQRTGDASDADADVVALQERHAPKSVEWPSIDAQQDHPAILRQAAKLLDI